MIIGLSGKIGSGKTEVVKLLVAEGFIELNFGTKLKEAVSLVFDIPLEQLHTQTGKATLDERWGTTPRFLLQRFGTEVCRTLHPHVWLYHLDKIIKNAHRTENFVIGDVRFRNEFEFVIRRGGWMWRLERPNHMRIINEHEDHPSETEVDNLVHAYYINNDGTLEELYQKVKFELRRIL